MKNQDGMVKNTNKPRSLWDKIGKKFAAGVVGVGIAVGAAFGFAGCTNDKPTPTPPGPGPEIPTPPPIVVVEDITLEKFISNYPQLAQQFVEDVVYDQVVEDKDVKSETWSLVANENNEITEVNILYTYSVDQTNRAVELASATLKTPISMQDIVDRKVVRSDLEIDRTSIFEFDAKANYDNQKISNALYDIMDENSSVKLINEVESPNASRRAFNYLVSKDNQIMVKYCEITKGNGSDATLIKNINLGNIYDTETKSTHNLDGTEIYNQGYTLENIEIENPGPGPDDPIKNPVSNAEIIEALDTKCADGIINECFSFTVDKENVSNETWYVTKNADGKITGAEYTFNYKRDNTSAYYVVGKVEFNSPISAEDLKDNAITNATYSQSYRVNYNPAIQEEKADLTNAICNKLFGENEGATRYIVDNGTNIDSTLGMEARRIVVIEINGNEVNETSINIKDASTDAGLIANLENQNNYRTHSEKSYTISGDKVEEKEEVQVQTRATKARYIISFDGMDDEFYL